ncbi:hypothetical protein N7474_009572 [Penicillium riverlandense]|uniref:uncharacterized protein n=1 Tax=Penicillium riverlandense TaxID=1903569 RepID=UPI00254942B6|nr:uncharacterized protein N7474_009572 [Penicillium riverlandense]KAJ5808303.1 hypothetical protein N7474_009572 [Penicillium riverlandense]
MGLDTESLAVSPQYEDANAHASDILEPTVLELSNQSILSASTPVYQLNGSVTTTSLKGSSIIFERINGTPNITDEAAPKSRTKHLFYLVHPLNAEYRTDVPAYYITSASGDGTTIGNIRFEVSKKSIFQKTEFKALLSPKRSASDTPLFTDAEKVLFHVQPKWKGGRYEWVDSDRKHLAFQDSKGDQQKLIITMAMRREVRDALVALWMLRIWYDTAESRQAKREGEYIAELSLSLCRDGYY